MATDIIAIYETAGDLLKEGRYEESLVQFLAGYEELSKGLDPDAESRRKLFAGKIGWLYQRLNEWEKCRPYFLEVGQTPPKKPTNLMSLNSGLNAMKKFGMVEELTTKLKKSIIEEFFSGDAEDGSALPDFLQCYYGHHIEDEDHGHTQATPRAIRDGVLTYDNRFANDSEDVVADFASLVGGVPIFETVHQDFYKDPFELRVKTADGQEHELDIKDIDDIAGAFNQKLEVQGDRRRFVSAESGGDYSFWILVEPDKFKKLLGGAKPAFELGQTPGFDIDKWKKLKA